MFTSLYGASEDLLNEGYRRTLINACYWAAGLESAIDGKRSIEFVGPYHPTTFRNGGHRQDVDPKELAAHPLRVGLSMEAEIDVSDSE